MKLTANWYAEAKQVVTAQYNHQHRWAVPRHFFSTGTVGTLEKSTGIAVPLLLFLNFLAVLGTFAKFSIIKKR